MNKAAEITREQGKMYKETDLEEVTARNALQAASRVKQMERNFQDTRTKNQEHNEADERNNRKLLY
jgi:hypothetical protein